MEQAIYKLSPDDSTIITPTEFQSIGSVPFRKVEAALYQFANNKDINCDELEIPFEYLVGSFFPDIMVNIHAQMTRQYIDGYHAGKEASK